MLDEDDVEPVAEILSQLVERVVSEGQRKLQYPLRTPRVKIQRQWFARLPINRWNPFGCIIR